MSSDVSYVKQLPPDSGLVRSLGTNHTLESALADLVDNSIDAGCARVSIRLLTVGSRLTQIEVHDDGHGMTDQGIDKALTIGHRRDYGAQDLGHFGIGLKAASLGQASTLTVWSTAEGGNPIGRRLRHADFSHDYSCEVLDQTAAQMHHSQRYRVLGQPRGTSVVWTEVKHVYHGPSTDEADEWLSDRADQIRSHLAVVFHRLIENRALEIDLLIDEVDDALDEPGVPIRPIDPFGYARSGHPLYPITILTETNQASITLKCHIWPPRSTRTGFHIGAKTGQDLQGFYIYRNDRLLQVGGWSEVAVPSSSKQLARVEVEYHEITTNSATPLLTINPEKSGLRFNPSFHAAISKAAAKGGANWSSYLDDAETVFKEANRRNTGRKPVIRPDQGLAPAVKRQIRQELPVTSDEPIRLRWRALSPEQFFEIDRKNSTLWLNQRYRKWYSPEKGTLNDAPLLKTLMYLLTHQLFEGHYLGPRDKDRVELWNSILYAAAEAESETRKRE